MDITGPQRTRPWGRRESTDKLWVNRRWAGWAGQGGAKTTAMEESNRERVGKEVKPYKGPVN